MKTDISIDDFLALGPEAFQTAPASRCPRPAHRPAQPQGLQGNNALLDLWLERQPEDQLRLIASLIDGQRSGLARGWIASPSLHVLEYLARAQFKREGADPKEAKDRVKRLLANLLQRLSPLSSFGFHQDAALLAQTDLEDAQIVAAAAELQGPTAIVTNDKRFDTAGTALVQFRPGEVSPWLQPLPGEPSPTGQPIAFVDLKPQQNAIRPAPRQPPGHRRRCPKLRRQLQRQTQRQPKHNRLHQLLPQQAPRLLRRRRRHLHQRRPPRPSLPRDPRPRPKRAPRPQPHRRWRAHGYPASRHRPRQAATLRARDRPTPSHRPPISRFTGHGRTGNHTEAKTRNCPCPSLFFRVLPCSSVAKK